MPYCTALAMHALMFQCGASSCLLPGHCSPSPSCCTHCCRAACATTCCPFPDAQSLHAERLFGSQPGRRLSHWLLNQCPGKGVIGVSGPADRIQEVCALSQCEVLRLGCWCVVVVIVVIPNQQPAPILRITGSQNGLGCKGAQRSPSSNPLLCAGHQPAAQAAQSHIQPGLGCLQGWGIHSLLGQPVPVPHHPLDEKLPPNIQPKPPISV